MRWLEDFRDDTERRVREALDVAASRNDDLALRRVWSRLADLVPRPPTGLRRLRWPVLLTAAGLLAGGVAAALVLPRLLQDSPHRWPSTLSAALSSRTPPPRTEVVTEAAAPAPAPEPLPETDPTPMLVGPAIVETGAREARAVRLKAGARLNLRGRSTLVVDAGQRPFLRYGRAGLEVAKQPPGETFSIAAGPYVVVVVGTKFTLGVSTRLVTVDVREGAVEIWKGGEMTRLLAGGSWRGPNRVGRSSRPRLRAARPVARPPAVPEAAQPTDSYEDAKAAIARNDTAIGLGMLHRVAQGDGAQAENAGYLIGRILHDQLYQPRQAIVAWKSYRERFPDGGLRHEADVSIIDTLLTLGDVGAARVEIEAFLRRHPHSERHAEMKALAARLAAMPSASGPPAALRAR